MILNKIRLPHNTDKIIFGLLVFVAIIVFAYTFRLSFKRYESFEFGKFDLGNMSQIVWNTSRGRVMEVTDQFGSNMKRYGMSHVDWVLVFFAPLYWIFPHPMLLVFVQNLFIVSGFIPLYFLIKKYSNSSIIAFISGLIYLFYPAHGFLLVWSEYHGVAHVAPLLIWLFWYIERLGYTFNRKREAVIFWLIFIFMLGGKEQVGFILGLFGLWVFLKNRKLGLQMFIIGMLYSFFCFLILIPHYVPVRNQSVNDFMNLIDHDISSGTGVIGDNFFLNRYTYLGGSYGDILTNISKDPTLIFEKWTEEDKLENLNYMYAPFAYLPLIAPFWLVALPDYMIAMMADVKGFLSIENQRVSLIIASLFVSYIIFISQMYRFSFLKKFKVAYIFALLCLVLTIQTSIKAENPLFISGVSFIQNKIVKKVFSQTESAAMVDKGAIGSVKDAKLPDNTLECRQDILSLVYEKNPSKYSGPDALGAYTSMREMNALFPAGIDKSDMFVTDIFDLKAYRSLKGIDQLKSNKNAVRKVINTGDFKHVYSCDRMSVFVRENQNSADEAQASRQSITNIKSRDNIIGVSFENTSDLSNIKYSISKESKSIDKDVVTYWRFVDSKNNKVLSFLDYKFWAGKTIWEDVPQGTVENMTSDIYFINSILEKGSYKVYYGFGSTSKAQETHAFDIEIL